MTTVSSFDTLKTYKKLVNAGMSPAQAEVIVESLYEILKNLVRLKLNSTYTSDCSIPLSSRQEAGIQTSKDDNVS